MRRTLHNSAYPLLGVLAIAFVSTGQFIVGGTSGVTGTYAGVPNPGCINCFVTDATGQETRIRCRDRESYPAAQVSSTCPTEECSMNALGVFSVGVPSTGISNGDFVMFAQGRVFTGTIRGTADPTSGTFSGTLDATFDFTVIQPNPPNEPTETTITASATGSMNAQIRNEFSFGGFGVTDARMKGTADLTISQGHVDGDFVPVPTCKIPLRVLGFRQSSEEPTTSG